MTMNKPQLPAYLQNISIVLCRTSHPANIGAAARAMKTMGLTKLTLVSPNLMVTPMTEHPHVFRPEDPSAFTLPEESFILASGAKDVLEEAIIVSSLADAIKDCTLCCALTSRKRELTASLQTPREAMPELLQAAQNDQKVALVFGNETFGLSIEEVTQCNRLITINGNPDYFSLNLAQAVQVISYELMSQVDLDMDYLKQETDLATREQVQGLIGHMQDTMNQLNFFERRNAERLMRRMHSLFDRADISKEEIDILRGFFKTIEKKIP
ncbi:RNA methyltransferase [Neisseria sp. Ec49-e6-T10]|uniref:RNA methyltransferase n=1 Tax=Neisseria sp. Ec49-e6-T10 TaxID=3140744 RepID=UPI003EBE227E